MNEDDKTFLELLTLILVVFFVLLVGFVVLRGTGEYLEDSKLLADEFVCANYINCSEMVLYDQKSNSCWCFSGEAWALSFGGVINDYSS